MQARIYKLASRLVRAVRANPFAVCVLVLIACSAVLVPQNTRASGASREVTPTYLLRDLRTQMLQNRFASRDGILMVPGATCSMSTTDRRRLP